jgi:hypothetical protein
MEEHYFKIGHDRSLPHASQLIYNYPTIRRYINYGVKKEFSVFKDVVFNDTNESEEVK